ncbi:MAG TPA: Hsp70 family protein [Ktedonosporobacter sp.]|nr:Hsp70 family protein [Ktedonosporobacter sp.]
MQAAQAVGIDLGTTFSAIAIFDEEGRARAIPNAEGTLTTPSIVIWHNDAFLVGQPALDLVQRAQGPERDRQAAALIRAVKRMIGNPPVGGLISNGHRTSPAEVSAAVLAKLARDASTHLGFKVQDAVITVPAHFGDRERSATKAAAELAGLRVLRMMNEPSAAALVYSIDKQATPGTVLVFDLGGGTFDATILQLEEKESRVLATQGIEELGGINFTKALADFLALRYASQTKTPYPQDSLSLERLISEAEAAKCRLSESFTTAVSLVSSAGQPVALTITREQFEDIIDLFNYQLQTAVEMALEQAKKTPADISRVLLCGGSSRIPAIQTMLADLFGRPPEQILDLDLSVALGAAYAAYNLEQAEAKSRQKPELAGLQTMSAGLIIDCVSYPVGIAVLNQRGDDFTKLVMLQTGDPLDTWSQPYTVRIVGAATEFPPISIYKGAGTRLDPADYLGEIALTLPPNTSTGARATIRMLQDQNGLIQVQLTVDGKELPGHLQRAAVLQ